jgi:MFS family permease
MSDVRLLFTTRVVRLFAYGFVSVVLVLYLSAIGLEAGPIGTLLTLILAGDVVVSLVLTTQADVIGRRRTLIIGALLMTFAAAVFGITTLFALLVIAGIAGVISPSGNEVGPFLAVEQVALAEAAPDSDRTSLFAWYNLSGSFATAIGSLAGGTFTDMLIERGFGESASYRTAIFAYGAAGLLLVILFAALSPKIESQHPAPHGSILRLHRSRGVVLRLSGLFALDSFAGGLVIQSASLTGSIAASASARPCWG